MTRGGTDKYTDGNTRVIKKEAGRRPASKRQDEHKMTREARGGKTKQEIPRRCPDKYQIFVNLSEV